MSYPVVQAIFFQKTFGSLFYSVDPADLSDRKKLIMSIFVSFHGEDEATILGLIWV